MSVMQHVKKFPVVSLPVRKQVAREGFCPECGGAYPEPCEAKCYVKGCGYEAADLLEYKHTPAVRSPAVADG